MPDTPPLKLRMAKARLEGDPPVAARAEADQVLVEIRRLFHDLQGLPYVDRPRAGRRSPPSLAYRTLETRIRWYADRYRVLTHRPSTSR